MLKTLIILFFIQNNIFSISLNEFVIQKIPKYKELLSLQDIDIKNPNIEKFVQNISIIFIGEKLLNHEIKLYGFNKKDHPSLLKEISSLKQEVENELINELINDKKEKSIIIINFQKKIQEETQSNNGFNVMGNYGSKVGSQVGSITGGVIGGVIGGAIGGAVSAGAGPIAVGAAGGGAGAAGYNVGDYIGSKIGSAIEDYIKNSSKSNNSGYKGSPGVNNNHYHYSIPSFDNLNSQE